MLDRARTHQDSLKVSKAKGKIPNKLQIRIQPLVIDKDQPEFKQKWVKTVKDCETKLVDFLIEHLENTIDQTKDIRKESTECLQSLQRDILEHKAREKLNETLRDAENKIRQPERSH